MFKELIMVFLSTFTFSLIFVFAFNNKGPWGNFWNFSIVDFMAVWAIISWLNPNYLKYNIFIVVFPVSLIMTLLLASSSPLPGKSKKVKTLEKNQTVELEGKSNGKKVYIRYNIYFWILLIILSIIILIRYLFGITSIGIGY